MGPAPSIAKAANPNTVRAVEPRVFIQRSRLGRVTFVLRDREIETFHGARGGPTPAVISLTDISPDYEVGVVRLPKLAMIMLVISAGLIALAWHVFCLEFPWPIFSMIPAMAAVIPAIIGVMFVRRIRFLRFYDRSRELLFIIAHEWPQVAESETFVADLLNRIERANAQALISPPMRRGLIEGTDPKPEWHWAIAIASGTITIGWPTIACWLRELHSPVPFVVLGGTAAAIVAALYSYAAKESRRHWSIVGVTLAVATFIIFPK
jgi:hypothetical protein